MKKILIPILAAAAFVALPAYAAELSAGLNGNTIVIDKTEGMSDSLVIVCYDKDGRMTYAGTANAEENKYELSVPAEYETVKAYDIGKDMYDVVLTASTSSPEATAVPETTETPEATASPEATTAPQKYLNPAYENETDQALAFGIVKKAVSSVNSSNEEIYVITTLLQGKEVDVPIEDDVEITYAPSSLKWIIGSKAIALKEGDAVFYKTNLAGNIVRSIELLCRPSQSLSGGGMESFFTSGSQASVAHFGSKLPSSRYSYAFGIITDKDSGGITLYSESGKASDALYLDYTKDTVTYIYDMDSNKDPYIGDASEIEKSWIPKTAYDDNDNITYSSEDTYNVALVRMVDRTAADIVVYENVELP